MTLIRIVLVDDQSLIRQGLKALLELEHDVEVVGEAENGQNAIALVKTLQPDVLLLDIRMPLMDGVAVTREVGQHFPDNMLPRHYIMVPKVICSKIHRLKN